LIQKIDEANAKLSAAQAEVTRAESTLQNEKAKLLEEQAKLDSDRLTSSRLAEAAKTPGAIAQNDVDISAKTVEADCGRVKAGEAAIQAAEAVVLAEQRNVQAAQRVLNSLRAMRSYLTIEAPFDGVISSRNVHEGSIVAVDAARSSAPLVRIQQVSLLRLVAAIPEDAVGDLHEGDKVPFTVAAFPGRKFEGTVARPAFALDESTRTMPVELNVPNVPRVLDPGMFCNVDWTVSRPYQTVFLPGSAVGTDLVGSYVNKIVDGVVTRIAVRKGDSMGNLIEVVGDLKQGDEVAMMASNELKTGSRLVSKLASAEQLAQANGKHEKAGGE
jgi:RND family efflux transporter MFP subunit